MRRISIWPDDEDAQVVLALLVGFALIVLACGAFGSDCKHDHAEPAKVDEGGAK